MRTKTLALIFVLVFSVICLCGCSDVIDDVVNSAAQFLSGDVTGQIGKTYSTQWFEFTIHSINKVDSYAGYEPASGYQLYDVLITEKNIFDESIPMGTPDFYMDDPDFEEYIWGIDPLDNTMMPEEFYLEPGETAQYHIIFEIPQEVTKLALMYTEFDVNDNEGATFTIYVK
jgi:hypothetical protein